MPPEATPRLPATSELPCQVDRYFIEGRLRARVERLYLTLTFDAAYELVLRSLGCRKAGVVADTARWIMFEPFNEA